MRELSRTYMRTSSATNVGADKDSETRQRVAIEAFAKRTGVTIVDWFYDPAVSGADPIDARPGFSALLDRLESNGVRTVVVEDASRFARDLVALLTRLRRRGVGRFVFSSLSLGNVRHYQAIGHSALEVLDHRRFSARD